MVGKWVLTRHVKRSDLPRALAFLDMMKVPYERKELKSKPSYVSIRAKFDECADPTGVQIAWQQFVFEEGTIC